MPLRVFALPPSRLESIEPKRPQRIAAGTASLSFTAEPVVQIRRRCRFFSQPLPARLGCVGFVSQLLEHFEELLRLAFEQAHRREELHYPIAIPSVLVGR